MPYTLIFGLFSQAFIGKCFPIQGYLSCIYANFEMNTCVFEIHLCLADMTVPVSFKISISFQSGIKSKKQVYMQSMKDASSISDTSAS